MRCEKATAGEEARQRDTVPVLPLAGRVTMLKSPTVPEPQFSLLLVGPWVTQEVHICKRVRE